MHVSPAKHSYAWLPRKCDYRTDTHRDGQTDRQTDRCRTKWSLCAAMLRRRHNYSTFEDILQVYHKSLRNASICTPPSTPRFKITKTIHVKHNVPFLPARAAMCLHGLDAYDPVIMYVSLTNNYAWTPSYISLHENSLARRPRLPKFLSGECKLPNKLYSGLVKFVCGQVVQKDFHEDWYITSITFWEACNSPIFEEEVISSISIFM